MYYPSIGTRLWRVLLYKLEKITSENILSLLLFLFPIFAVSVRHWVSSFFGLLVIFCLVLFFRRRVTSSDLENEEKWVLWAFVFYFAAFLLTSIANDWSEVQTRYLGVEIRYLFFFPLYLLIRQVPDAFKWLLYGCVVGVAVSFIDAFYGHINGSFERYEGAYSVLFAGPVILMMSLFLIPGLKITDSKWSKVILIGIVLLGIYVVYLSGARNAYFSVIALSVLYSLLVLKGYYKFLATIAVVGLSVVAYYSSEVINSRVNIAYSEYQQYRSYANPAEAKTSLSSVGTRLEMWRATPYFMKDNPLFGVGRGNYKFAVKEYINAKQVHPGIGTHAQLHNIYSEVLISKGLVGLVAFIGISFVPLIVLLRDFRNRRGDAIFAILLILAYLTHSLSDAALFIKGNYTAFYIIFLATFFSYHMQVKIKQRET